MITRDTPVQDLFEDKILTARATNICLAYHLLTVGTLIDFYQSNGEFLLFRNIGAKANSELKEFCSNQLIEGLPETAQHDDDASLLLEKYATLSDAEKQMLQLHFEELCVKNTSRLKNVMNREIAPDRKLLTYLQNMQKLRCKLRRIHNVGASTVSDNARLFSCIQQAFAEADNAELNIRTEAAIS